MIPSKKTPQRILIAPDKFKGTLTAEEAAEAMASGWRRVRPDDLITRLPISDGGDGFGRLLGRRHGAEPRTLRTVDAAREPIEAVWWWAAPSQTAFADAAEIVGLARLIPGRYHPFELDTFGLGGLMAACRQAGARRLVLGIGGSATNDAGFGMAGALGWRFFDAENRPIDRWSDLARLDRVLPSVEREYAEPPEIMVLQVAVDVQNPLLGPAGATRVYGPQKGLTETDFPTAEAALARLAAVLATDGHRPDADLPGAGAAGGLGFGLRRFLGARLEPGFALFARESALPDALAQTDLVLTGEGSLDESTWMGKGVGELAHLCRKRGIDCRAIAGVHRIASGFEDPHEERPIKDIQALSPDLATSEAAQADPARFVAQAAQRIAQRAFTAAYG